MELRPTKTRGKSCFWPQQKGRELRRSRERIRGNTGVDGEGAEMSSSTSGHDDDAPDLVCQIDCVHGMVDTLSCVRWKRHQDAVMELLDHGIVITFEASGCLQAKVFLKRELFVEYEYVGDGRPRFGLSLGLLVDCLNVFSTPGHASAVKIRYPGSDMQLLLKNQNQNSRYNLL